MATVMEPQMVHKIQQRDHESSRGAVIHQIQPVKERLATAAVMQPQVVHKIQQRDHESSRGAVAPPNPTSKRSG
jgi:hypothetical protein